MRREKLEELQDYIKELKAKKIKLIEKPEKKTFLKIETYQCELENGSRLEREKLKKGKRDGSAAIILPITKKKKYNSCRSTTSFYEKWRWHRTSCWLYGKRGIASYGR